MDGLLLFQDTNFEELKVLNESSSGSMYITGPFFSCNRTNRNGRTYPKTVVEPEVSRYINERITTRTGVGEFQHPDYPMPNFKKAAIKVVQLQWDGDLLMGKAKVLNTDEGRKVRELLEEDIRLGISSRGLGKTDASKTRVTRYQLNAFDVVENPSGIECFVDPLNESVQFNADGSIYRLTESQVDNTLELMSRKVDAATLITALETSLM